VKEMLSMIPIRLEDIEAGDIDKEILRVGIIAEYDAINLYEQMAALAKSKDIKKVMLDVAKEEKEHVGEFQSLLLRLDKQQLEEMEEGKKEVEELVA
jgi:rubrerythrin